MKLSNSMVFCLSQLFVEVPLSERLFVLPPLHGTSPDLYIMYLAKYISWIGRAAILSLESEEFICLLVPLNTARKKSSLPLSLETPGTPQSHCSVTPSLQ